MFIYGINATKILKCIHTKFVVENLTQILNERCATEQKKHSNTKK